MNAPLSRYLTRFSSQPTEGAAPLPEPALAKPTATLTLADLAARLDAARDETRATAQDEHAQELAALAIRHETVMAEAIAAAQGERTAADAEALLAQVADALAQLRDTLAEATAKVLRPLVADAVRERTLAALGEAVGCLLADPAHPAITLRAPEKLVAAIRARGAPAGMELVVADIAEAVVLAGATRIETRLAAALAEFAVVES